MKLEDFKLGIVAGIQWPKKRDDQAAIAKIQGWIDAGQLICPEHRPTPDNPKPHPMFDWLIVPSVEDLKAKPDAGKRAKPQKQVRGSGWLVTDLEWVDGLRLNAGTRVEEFNPPKAGVGDIAAAKSCASRIERDTGSRPMLALIQGVVRVVEQRWLAGERPA